MPFRGVFDPDELAVLSQTLEEHCAENGIGPEHDDRELIALRLIGLYTSGITTVDELKLILRKDRARRRA